jgi:hypothetical protein
MEKFIITETNRWLVEANSLEDAQYVFRMARVNGHEPENAEYLDGSTTYEPTEEN